MNQPDLFAANPDPLDIELPGGALRYWPRLIAAPSAEQWLAVLMEQVAWEQSDIVIAGRRLKIPRLNAWYGDAGADYQYSGRQFKAISWLPVLLEIRKVVEAAVGHNFNSALLNLYRDGRDSVDWHSDDEPELGENPLIASLSLGAVRPFQLRHKTRKELSMRTLELEQGSLLLMSGALQHHWRHRLPKLATVVGPRVNVTFRNVVYSQPKSAVVG